MSENPRKRASATLARLALLALVVGAAPAAAEVIELIPEDRAGFRLRNVFAWVRPVHYFGQRVIEIRTTPPGATLDLFYVRANFQKGYEQTEAPVTVVLPRRIEAGPRDALNVRAFLEGYRQRQASVRIDSGQESIHLELEPLPNKLAGVSHTYFAGRASLAFLTQESLRLRVQKREGGFGVILAETARGPDLEEGISGIRSPLIREVQLLQLGEDLLFRIEMTEGARDPGIELRSRQNRDEIRDLYVYSVDMVPEGGAAESVARARAALASLRPSDVSGCALEFERVLRESLDRAELARALAPRGAFTDPYLRAAMKRLGEVSPGARVAMIDGARFDPRNQLEISAAMGQPELAVGYLALLRSFVTALEGDAHAADTLRSLIAPEERPSVFAQQLRQAERAERGCREQGAGTR